MFALVVFLTLATFQQAASPVGTWEGALETPRRPVIVTLRVEHEGTAWTGTLSISGQRPIPLSEVTFEDGHFRFTAGNPPMDVRARVQDQAMIGTLVQGDQSFSFRLEREPDLPPPPDRVEAWRQDLDAVERKLPVRLWWFADGLRVVKATTAHRDLVGCAVTEISGHLPSRVRKAVAPLFAGNASWREYMSVYSMTSPEVLFGLGLVNNMENIHWQFRCAAQNINRTLTPLPLAKSASPTEAWWDLSPVHKPTTNEEWISAPVVTLPLYLRHAHRFYWHEYLPDAQALYVNYSRSQQMPSGPSLKEYARNIAEELRDRPVKRIVIDLRFNTGGDLGLGRAVMEDLRALAQTKQATVAVISGRATFSAGLFHLAQWKRCGATIVGEPVGDDLDFWSEGGNIILPNSKLYVHYANGFHTYSRKDYPEFKPYFADLDVDTVSPDVPVHMTWDQYVLGEDPALLAALNPR